MNTFSPAGIREILRLAQTSLADRRGALILEIQTPEVVERCGRSEPSEEECSGGLFSDAPYRCRTEWEWLPEPQIAIQTFTVTEKASGQTRVYRNTTKVWKVAELTSLLTDAGFSDVSRCADWPCNTDSLALWKAEME